MAINKSLNIGVTRAYKQGDWVGFTAVEVITKELRNNADISGWGKAGKIIEEINKLLRTEGYKINESIDDTSLSDQIRNTTNKRDEDYKRMTEFYTPHKSKFTGRTWPVTGDTLRYAREKEVSSAALDYVVQAMLKEQKLRDEVNFKIDVAKKEDTLDSWNKIKDDWRTLEQKKTIKDNIKRVESVAKTSEEATKAEAEKQAKLDKLNQQIANTTDVNEKKAIAAQISEVMGTVSEQTGMPKSYLYIGVGVAVIVGVWIIIKAIKK
jgi:hypothetical protein